jgi:predicted MFS family arabinose efflux permease
MSPREWLLLFVLATVQFTHNVDFVLLMPLAPRFEYTPQQFALVVSVYGLSAALAGLLLAPLLDRVDRKLSLLWLFAGFGLSTLFCGLAPSYAYLVAARAAAGAFGGVAAACVLAIIGDAFPPARRGTALGAVMSAFSIALILGVPVGLLLADHYDTWRAPFVVLGGLSMAVWALGFFVLPSQRRHLDARSGNTNSLRGVFTQLLEVVTLPRHLAAFGLMVAMVLTSFVLVPYLAEYNVNNLRLPKTDLWKIYLVGGLATLVTMNVVGRLADRFNRLWLFRILVLASTIPIVALISLPAYTPLPWILLTTTGFMMLTSGRFVPAMTLITGTAEARVRGSFLSLTTSLQQLASGVAPLLAGQVLGETSGHEPLVGFHILGLVAVGGAVLCAFIAGFLRQAPGEGMPSPVIDPELAPMMELAPSEAIRPASDDGVYSPGEQCA